jgi:hypothetical protein
LGIIALKDEIVYGFNTLQILTSPGIDENGNKKTASILWCLWEQQKTKKGAIHAWEQSVEEMHEASRRKVFDLPDKSGKYLGDDAQGLLENYENFVNRTKDSILRNWKDSVSSLFDRFKQMRYYY